MRYSRDCINLGFNNYSFDIEKRPRRTPKPKKHLVIDCQSRLSTYSIRYISMSYIIIIILIELYYRSSVLKYLIIALMSS